MNFNKSIAHFLLFIFLILYPCVLPSIAEEAIFAGGCFWCLEHDLEALPGVVSVESGYSGGDLPSPTYEQHKGHQESVIVYFDAEQISYEKLLRSFWRNVDPFDSSGQFCDRGDSYRPVIFAKDENQQKEALISFEKASNELSKPLKDIEVEIQPAKQFWLAEDYHQNFADRNKYKYKFYRYSCGRDARLDEIWGERARTSTKWQP